MPLQRNRLRASGPAQFRCVFHFPGFIVRHLAAHYNEWLLPNYRFIKNRPFRFYQGKEKAVLHMEPARGGNGLFELRISPLVRSEWQLIRTADHHIDILRENANTDSKAFDQGA